MSDPEPNSLTHSWTLPERQQLHNYHPEYRLLSAEYEDDSSSEPHEAITPTSSDSPPLSFPFHIEHGLDQHVSHTPTLPSKQSLIINTAATPPRPALDGSPQSSSLVATDFATTTTTTVQSPEAHDGATRRPPPPPRVTTDFPTTQPSVTKLSFSRVLKNVFRRTSSHSPEMPLHNPFHIHGTSETAPRPIPSSYRGPSASRSADNSPAASGSHTPTSSVSPSTTVTGSPERQYDFTPRPFSRDNYSATGFHFRINKPSIAWDTLEQHSRQRALNAGRPSGIAELGAAEYFSRPAETGAGLKARRMSISLPDDFIVDSVELDKEFTSASRMPGKRGRLLGKGATATVKLMTRKGHGDEIYAVKEFRKRGQNENEEDYDKKVKSEYTIAKSLRHPNIVESFRLCTHAGRWNVVMEYCSQGELYSLVEKRYFLLEDKLCLWKQLVRGVAYLHNHGIAHRDIKLENLLLTEQGHLKITDFGVSEVFSGEHPGLREAGGECGKNMKDVRRCAPGICGSLPYIAPEVLEKKGEYDPRPLDVWSTAMVLLSMLFGGQPWSEASLSQSAYAKFHAAFEKFTSTHPDTQISDTESPSGCGPCFSHLPKPAIRILLLRMLHPDPERRACIQDIAGDRWVKTIECCSDESEEELIRAANTCGKTFDASKGGKNGTVKVKKLHNHLPPKVSKMPKHRFDMGDGY